MFSGIISHTGTVKNADKTRLTISATRGFCGKLQIGTSVAVEGVCLTVVGRRPNTFTADIMSETNVRTNLGKLFRGSVVNLELPVTPNTFLSGHLVQGHVDISARVARIDRQKEDRVLRFSIPRTLSKYVVGKGSIAVNGVSLTVMSAGQNHFTVGIIPHTWRTTSMHALKPGDPVNIEVDVIGKYLEKLLKTHA
ncbi:riboflavin synthase [Candidatus Kaiserbacteria bacterium]|nr:riboflavin synthase [Candidatus Kaiserbacteria bacterium]